MDILVVCVKTIDEWFMTRLRAAKSVCQYCLIVPQELRDILEIRFSEPDKVLSDQNACNLIDGLLIFDTVSLLSLNVNEILGANFYFFEMESLVDNARNALVIGHLVEKTNRKCQVHTLVFKDGVLVPKQTFPPPRQ